MRKITSFLALFLLFTGTAIAQISSLSELVYNTKAYSVETVAGKNYRATSSGYDRSGWYSKFGSTSLVSYRTAGIAYYPTEANQQFIFEKDGSENVYIYAVGVGKYLNKDNTYSTTPQDAVTIVANSAYSGAFTFYFDSSHYINSNGSGTISIDTWSTHDDGNGVYLTEQRDASAAIAEAFTNAKTAANAGISALNTNMPSVFTAANVTSAQGVINSTTDIQSLYAADLGIDKYVQLENRANAGVYLCAGASAASRTSDFISSIIHVAVNPDGTFYLQGYDSGSYLGDVSVSTDVTTTTTPSVKYTSYVPATGYISVRPVGYSDTGWSAGYHFIHFGGNGVVGWEYNNNSSQFTIAEVSLADVKAVYCSDVENFPTMIPSVYTAADVTTAKAAINGAADFAALKNVDLGIDKYITMENKSMTGLYLNIGETAASRSSDATNSVIHLIANTDGTFYMQGFTSRSYLGDVVTSTAVTTTTTPEYKYVGLMVGDYLCVRPVQYTDAGRNFIHFGGSGVVGWETSGDATQFTVAEVAVPVTISYVVKQNNVEIWRTTAAANSGDVLTAFPSDLLRDYTTLSYPNAPYTVTGADGQEFVANITAFTPPFTLSTDYATATWYIWHQHTSNSGSTVYTNGDNIVWATSGSTYEKARQFAFMGDPYNGIQIINRVQGAGKYLSNTDPATMTTTPYGWQLREQTNSTYINGHTGTFGLYNTANSQYLNGQQGTLKYWGSFDQGSTSWVEIVPALDYTMTYVIKDGEDNTLFTSSPVETYYHATVNSLPSDAYYNMSAFYDYSDPNVTIENVNTNVEFVATPKATPLLQYTEDTTDPVYYNLNIRSKYLVYNSSATGEVTLQDESEPFHSDASWAFVGTPYGGFKLYNKTKGTSYVLTYSSVVPGANQSNNNVVFEDATTAASKLWYINTNSNGFVLRMKENPDIYFHHDNGYNFLRTCSLSEWWNVHDDTGSTIVTATDDDVLIALYNSMSGMVYGTELGQYTATGISAADANATVSQAGSAISNGMTTAYPDAYSALKTVKDATSLNMPTTGMFLRIKTAPAWATTNASAFSNTQPYLVGANDGTQTTRAAFSTSSTVNTEATSMWYYMPVSGTNYLVSYGTGYPAVSNSSFLGVGTGEQYLSTNGTSIVFEEAANGEIGSYNVKFATDPRYLYTNAGLYSDAGGSANDAGYNFQLEEVTSLPVTVTSAGYSTLYLPVAVEIPSGVSAYASSVVDGMKLMLIKLTDVIPANTPVVLEAEAGTYMFNISSESGSTPGTNLLQGTVATIPCDPRTSYTLQRKDGKVGFYLYTGTKLNGFKAYLPYSEVHDTGIRGFAFEDAIIDTTTGVDSVEVEGRELPIYDLQGRRVLTPAKGGIYIIGGRKTLVK